MTGVDWILLAVLLISLLLGFWRGLIYEVLSVASWLAAFFAALWLAPQLAAVLPLGDLASSFRYAAAFVIVFIIAAFAGGLLASLIRKAVTAIGLRPVDRTLGMVFGLLRAAILLLAVTVVARMVPALGANPAWRDSVAAPYLTAALVWIKPTLPSAVARFVQ